MFWRSAWPAGAYVGFEEVRHERLVEKAWKAFDRSADAYAQWEADKVKRIRTEIAAGKVFGLVL